MSAGIEITVGEHTAKVYGITNRGRPAFQVSFYRAGKRQRLTFSKLTEAKSEARIAWVAMTFEDGEEVRFLVNREAYRAGCTLLMEPDHATAHARMVMHLEAVSGDPQDGQAEGTLLLLVLRQEGLDSALKQCLWSDIG